MSDAERRRLSTTIDPEVLARLYTMKDRLGLSIAEQIERGARLWLDTMEWPVPDRRRHEPRSPLDTQERPGF